jgi:hypothetical protein
MKSSASALLSGPSTSTSALRQGTLAAPLPTVVTERLAREAAYQATKAEGDKWGGVMKRIKEAEHLQFPLQGSKGAKDRQRGGVKSAGDLVGGFQVRFDWDWRQWNYTDTGGLDPPLSPPTSLNPRSLPSSTPPTSTQLRFRRRRKMHYKPKTFQ